MNITVFPYVDSKTSLEVKDFADKLVKTFNELKVNIVKFELYTVWGGS